MGRGAALLDRSIALAMNVSMEAHHGQPRKYTGEPYWLHCLAVYDQVTAWGGTVPMRCASLLHDTIEDTDMTEQRLLALFGAEVSSLVVELTDFYTRDAFRLNRAQRKRLESDRIAKTSVEARVVKLADINNNTESIMLHDKDGFGRVYLPEKEYLLSVMGDPLAEFRAKYKIAP